MILFPIILEVHMKKLPLFLLILMLLCGCSRRAEIGTTARTESKDTAVVSPQASAFTESAAVTEELSDDNSIEETETEEPISEGCTLNMRINDTPVQVLWEENESVTALTALVQEAPLTITMSPYGGFEQVGPIGGSLPRNDVQTVTESGDIVLYSGNQIVVFYGSNTWAYTRLGHITDKTPSEMAELLGNGAVTITISMEDAT